MSQATEFLSHPVLGDLTWQPEYDHWSGERELASGQVLDLIIEPGEQDRRAFIPRAAELFSWALANERKVFADALQAELLELYNSEWREDEAPLLSAAEFSERLEWQLVCVSASDLVPVEFMYEAGELFGGHGVSIEVDSDLNYRDCDLPG